MKRRLTLLMIAVFLPVLLLTAYGMSERSFTLSMAREQERAQMAEGMISAELKKALAGMEYSELTQAAGQLRNVYASQGIELLLCYNGVPLGGSELPHENYKALFTDRRCAMLDTLSQRQTYAIAQPITGRATLLTLRDVSDLYRLQQALRRDYLLYALIGAALTAGLSYLLARGFTMPVARLTAAVKALSVNGEQAASLPTRRRDELGTLARSFEEMQAAVNTREALLTAEAHSRQALLDALAHEMRTPLCALLGNARLLQTSALPAPKQEAALEDMAREIKRLACMDEQLMKLTRLSHEPIASEPVALLPLLRDTAKRVEAQAENITIQVTGDNVTINGDPALLSLLCDNLTVNALRASAPGQTVTLTAFFERGTVGGFSIEDNGVGMTEEQLAHAFEPFYKGDKARTRRAGGAGLGLSLCQRIAQLHGGTLTLSSQVGHGVTAVFTTSLHPIADFVTSPDVSSDQEVDEP